MHKTNVRHWTAALVVGAAVLLAACGDDDDTAGRRDAPEADDASNGSSELPAGSSWVATTKSGLTGIAVYADAASTEPMQTITNPNEHGVPQVFLVDGTDIDVDRLPVYLPVAPNGSTGFVNTADVDLAQVNYSIRVELEARKMTVTRGQDEVLVDTPVGVGMVGRETQPGTYFIKELFQPPDPGGLYGPYAYGISSFSADPEVLAQFPGGVVGIHGTNDPDSIGSNQSNGCIRVPNDVITEMAGYLPLGTPVEVVA